MSKQKGLYCNVYRNAGVDCSNNGISKKNESILLLHYHQDKNIGPFSRTDDEPVLLAVYRDKYDDWIAVPEDYVPNQMKYMFGGNFLYTSDGRFPSKCPMKIFDRRE